MAGLKDLSGTQQAAKALRPFSLTLQKRKKKYYFEREGIRTKLLFQQQSLLKSTLPSEELFGFLQVLMEISFEG